MASTARRIVPLCSSVAAGYLGSAVLLALLLLRDQARPFAGEDWLDSITVVLARFGQFEGGFSWRRGLHLGNLLASSYGPLFYLYEVGRVLPFKVGLAFDERTFRWVTGAYAFLGVVAIALVARRELGRSALALLLILVAFSPGYLQYFRTYGAYYVLLHALELLVAVSLLAFLRAPRLATLVVFYAALLLLVSSTIGAANTLVACLVLLLLGPGDASTGEGWSPRLRLLFGRPSRLLLAGLFLGSAVAVILFNYRHYDELVNSSYHYQGVYAHALQKVARGPVSVAATAAVMAREAARGLHPVFGLLLVIAVFALARDRVLSPLGRFFLVVFILAALQCLLLVPTEEVDRNFRFIYYCFPLLVVVADVAGRYLSSFRRGGLVVGLALVLTFVFQRVHPSSDVASIVQAEVPATPEKALGFVLRKDALVEEMRACTGANRALDGPRTFYLDRVGRLDVFAVPREASTFCGLIVFDPESLDAPRLQKIIARSRLDHRIVVTDGGRPRLSLFLDDRQWARWGEPATLDMEEYSRRFSRDYRSIDVLFGPRWLGG
jgi:hypothetical protein